MNNNQGVNLNFKCPICGNTDSRYIGFRKGKPYCRKCITFRGQEATDDYRICDKAEYQLDLKNSKSCLIN